MSILFVTYDLDQPGRDYKPIWDYLKKHTYCRGTEGKRLESSWLIETTKTPKQVRDEMRELIDANDVLFVVKITKQWAAVNYYCGSWLNKDERNW